MLMPVFVSHKNHGYAQKLLFNIILIMRNLIFPMPQDLLNIINVDNFRNA